MTDEIPPAPPGPDLDSPAPDADPAAAVGDLPPIPPPPAPPPRRRGQWTLVPWVFALAFVVLGLAVVFLWRYPGPTQTPSPEAQRIDQLAQQVQALDAKVKQLASRPTPTPPAPPDLSGLENRLSALEHKASPAMPPPVDLGPLQEKLAGVEQQVAALAGLRARMSQLGDDQHSLAAQVQALTTGAKSADSGLAGRIDQQGQVIDALRADVGRIDVSLGRTADATRAEAALAALQAGRPLGVIAGAPPAVTRFATELPPTVASLRRGFPEVARAALAASRPNDADKRFLDRVWTRAQDLVTVRQGDHVLVGDPAAGVVARARDDIDAGDVAGAVDALSTLTGGAAQVVAGWLGSARALLEARSALVGMAGQGAGQH